MSLIKKKPFDIGKRIIRSIFLGSPNVLSTSDLNRQIEALKYQLDSLSDKTCVVSDLSIKAIVSMDSSGTKKYLQVDYNYSYIEHKGCIFSPPKKSQLVEYLENTSYYLCLVASKKTITYDNDPTHEISGALFEDGTSRPAANQEVYYNEQIVLSSNIGIVKNLVGILSVIQNKDGHLVTFNNCLKKEDSLAVSLRTPTIKLLDSSTRRNLHQGMTHDEAFSTINNRFRSGMANWTRLTAGNGVQQSAAYRFLNGILYLTIERQHLRIKTTRVGGSYGMLGILNGFPSDVFKMIQTNIVNGNSMGIVQENGMSIYPIQKVFTGNLFNDRTSDDPTGIIYGQCSCYLTALLDSETNEVQNLALMYSVDSALFLGKSGNRIVSGPVGFLEFADAIVYVDFPQQNGIVPIIG